MQIETSCQPFAKARASNYSTNGYPTRVPVAAVPSGDGVINMTGPNGLCVVPYAIGADAATFSVRAIGWRQVGEDASTALWIPVTLAEIACTITSGMPGVAGKVILDTELFADTLSVTKGNAGVSVDAVSPANDTAGSFTIDAKGFQKIELVFTTGGSATSCNALWSKV